MKTQLQSTLIAIIITGLFFSCKKTDHSPGPTDPAPLKMVKQVTASPTDFVNYEYDAKGNVVKYISQWQNGTGTINRLNNVFEYSGNKLVKFSNEAGYATFGYKGNVIDNSDHYVVNGKKLSSFYYTFDASGKITTILEQITDPAEDAINETRFDYQYYSNGNVSRIDYSYRKEITGPFILTFSKVYVEYDNKKNPEPDGIVGFFLPGVILQRNNPLKINNVLPNGTIEGYSRYEYTYGPDGYPLSRKHFIATENNEKPPVTYQYTY